MDHLQARAHQAGALKDVFDGVMAFLDARNNGQTTHQCKALSDIGRALVVQGFCQGVLVGRTDWDDPRKCTIEELQMLLERAVKARKYHSVITYATMLEVRRVLDRPDV